MKGKRINRDLDFNQFLKVLRRDGRPDYLPFYEFHGNGKHVSERMETDINNLKGRAWCRCIVEFWMSLGFDSIPMEIGLDVKRPPESKSQSGGRGFGSESRACIKTLGDLEKVVWPPDDKPINFEPFERVGEVLPPGMKIVGGVGLGPFEYVSQLLLGIEGLSFALFEQPEMVDAIFAKLKTLYTSGVRHLAAMDCIGACRQGDDLGFKTSTFLPPDTLRKYVFPIYKSMAAAAHAQNKPFILHSCGNLNDVYEDIIACGVDAKHSFEDAILPVQDFKIKYGKRITPLGGLDVDVICRVGEKELREYTRQNIHECFADGHWALGTGNALVDYIPFEKYLWVLDEGAKGNKQ